MFAENKIISSALYVLDKNDYQLFTFLYLDQNTLEDND